MKQSPLRIGIGGAGIAGLAAAAFLARDGHEVTVFDQFPEPHPVGSGLMVQPVGLAVLRVLGLDQKLMDLTAPVARVLGRNRSGRAVLDVRYDDLRADACGFGTQRALLFNLLLQAARGAGAQLVTDSPLSGALVDHVGATLTSPIGELGRFDLVLDCLGTDSPLCPQPSQSLAFGALWALLDFDRSGPFRSDWLEQRYHRAAKMAGILPVGRLEADAKEKLTFFWSLRGSDFANWRATPLEDWKADVTALWPDLASVLEQIVSRDDLIFARYTHRTLRQPGNGRIAHLGDSFHATSPQLGQGANMALLDAFALTHALRARSNPSEATALYAQMRRWHVRLYQAASWLFTPVYQSDSRVLPWLRDWVTAPLGRVPPGPWILARLVAGETGDPLGKILDRA